MHFRQRRKAFSGLHAYVNPSCAPLCAPLAMLQQKSAGPVQGRQPAACSLVSMDRKVGTGLLKALLG